jgi:4-amino-4-deoxy-L-arabinose transferase-like glycosyltransferase
MLMMIVKRSLLAQKLLLVLLVAIIVRLAVFVAVPSVFRFDQTDAIHGSEAYDTYATNLVATGVYGRESGVPDALLPPLYSYVLAAVYGVFGRGAWQVIIFHIVLDCASIVLLYHIGKRLMPQGKNAGVLAGLFYALYPYLIFQNLTLIDTPLFVMQLHAFVLLMILLRERPGWDRGTFILAVSGGVVFGLSMLTRAILPPLAILVAVWFLLRLDFWQVTLRLFPVVVTGILVMLPWMIRNYGIYEALVPTSLNFGDNFYQGNSEYTIPYFRAGYDVQWVPPPATMTATDAFSLLAARERFDAGLQYLRSHPDQIPDLLGVKFLVHWSIDIAPRKNPVEGRVPRLDYQGNVVAETGNNGEIAALTELPPGDPVGEYSSALFNIWGRRVHIIYWGSLLLLSIAGIWLTRKDWRDVSLIWFVQISMTIIYLIFHPSTRYRVPSDPLLFLFAAATLITVWSWRSGRRSAARRTMRAMMSPYSNPRANADV